MTERVVDVGAEPARLSVRHGQLVIERVDREPASTPLEDLAVLVLEHPAAVLSAAVLGEVAANGGSVVVSGRDHMPVAMLLPLLTHSVQSERHARQVGLSEPTRKRLWQQLVRAKIRAQSLALIAVCGEDAGLGAMATRVRSGDPDNLEAQAARRYWPLLFSDPCFRRGSDYGGRNAQLNYGYAVLRAGVARALCAAGLHPSLGLQHHNRYDPFCLASDLMEPYRPVVDMAVAGLPRPDSDGDADGLVSLSKAAILEFWSRRYECEGERRALGDVLQRAAGSLARVVAGEARNLALPFPRVIADPHGLATGKRSASVEGAACAEERPA